MLQIEFKNSRRVLPSVYAPVLPVQGLFSENKEKLINNAILALLSQETELPGLNSELESHFQAIRRLVASKAGFQAFTQLPKYERTFIHAKTLSMLLI